MQVLLPGDPLPVPSTSTSLHLGPGLASSSSSSSSQPSSTPSIRSTRAGLLGSIPSSSSSSRYWIESSQKRYIPSPTEPVLGIITARHAEGFRVDIGSSQSASLDGLAFEGATKRNKPNLKVKTKSLLSFSLSETEQLTNKDLWTMIDWYISLRLFVTYPNFFRTRTELRRSNYSKICRIR